MEPRTAQVDHSVAHVHAPNAPADPVTGLQDHDRPTGCHEVAGSTQAGHAGANHHDRSRRCRRQHLGGGTETRR